MEYLWKIFQKFWQVAMVILAALLLGAIWLYDYLVRMYDTEDFIFFGAVAIVLYILAHLIRLLIRNVKVLDDLYMNLVSKIRSRSNNPAILDDDIVVRNENWLKFVTETYKPGRRKPSLPLGFTTSGAPVEISMTGNESHLMLTGGTGLGKGVLMNQFIVAAAMSGLYQVVVVARSGKDYTQVANMKNVHLRTFSDDPDPIRSMQQYVAAFPLIMRSAYSEVVRRQNLCEENKVSKISDIRSENRPPHILLVVEEFSDTAAQIRVRESPKAQQDMFAMVAALTKIGRSSNFHLVLINQSPVGEIPRPVRVEMRKATFALSNSTDSFWATDVKGAGAELLYRYTEDDPEQPGELLYIAANATHVIRPAFTSGRMVGIAAKFYQDVKDAGEPTWLYGWKTPLQHETAVSETVEMPTRKMTVTEAPTQVSMPTGNGSVATAVAPPIVRQQTAVSRELSCQQVMQAAGWLYDNHKAWSGYREKQAFSKLHTQGVFLLLNTGVMSKTAIMNLVFNGKNGRYNEFVNLCESYLGALQKRYQEKIS